MIHVEDRLKKCFRLAMPAVRDGLLSACSQATTPEWDSLANVNLLALIEEEFSVQIPEDALIEFQSWDLILDWLKSHAAC
jgi:hypothetical protein